MKFQIGDRVVRRKDVHDRTSELLHGTVSKAIRNWKGIRGWNYPEIYSVTWDDGKVENGFLPHGLDFERNI